MVYEEGDILRCLIEDDEKRRFLVGSDGSTERVYYMEVNPECKTCKEAYDFLSNLDEKDCVVQV